MLAKNIERFLATTAEGKMALEGTML